MLRSMKHKRNKPCGCDSGKKLKNCCLTKIKRVQAGLEEGKSHELIANEELFLHTPRGN
jgi:hypothetical protein